MAALRRALDLLARAGDDGDTLLALLSLHKHLPSSVLTSGDDNEDDPHAATIRRHLCETLKPAMLRPPPSPSVKEDDVDDSSTQQAMLRCQIAHSLAAKLLSSPTGSSLALHFRPAARLLCHTVLTICHEPPIEQDDGNRGDDGPTRLQELLSDALFVLHALVSHPLLDLGDTPPSLMLTASLRAVASLYQASPSCGSSVGNTTASSLLFSLGIALQTLRRWQAWVRRAKKRRCEGEKEHFADEYEASTRSAITGMFSGEGSSGEILEALSGIFASSKPALAPHSAAAGEVLALLVEQLHEDAPIICLTVSCSHSVQQGIVRWLAASACDDDAGEGNDGAVGEATLDEATLHGGRSAALALASLMFKHAGLQWLVQQEKGKEAPATSGFLALLANLTGSLVKGCCDDLDCWLLQDASIGSLTIEPALDLHPDEKLQGQAGKSSKKDAKRPFKVEALTRKQRNLAAAKGYDRCLAVLLSALALFRALCKLAPQISGDSGDRSVGDSMPAELRFKTLQALHDCYGAAVLFLQSVCASPVRGGLESLARLLWSDNTAASSTDADDKQAQPSPAEVAAMMSEKEDTSLPLRSSLSLPAFFACFKACVTYLFEVDDIWSSDSASASALQKAETNLASSLMDGDASDLATRPRRIADENGDSDYEEEEEEEDLTLSEDEKAARKKRQMKADMTKRQKGTAVSAAGTAPSYDKEISEDGAAGSLLAAAIVEMKEVSALQAHASPALLGLLPCFPTLVALHSALADGKKISSAARTEPTMLVHAVSASSAPPLHSVLLFVRQHESRASHRFSVAAGGEGPRLALTHTFSDLGPFLLRLYSLMVEEAISAPASASLSGSSNKSVLRDVLSFISPTFSFQDEGRGSRRKEPGKEGSGSLVLENTMAVVIPSSRRVALAFMEASAMLAQEGASAQQSMAAMLSSRAWSATVQGQLLPLADVGSFLAALACGIKESTLRAPIDGAVDVEVLPVAQAHLLPLLSNIATVATRGLAVCAKAGGVITASNSILFALLESLLKRLREDLLSAARDTMTALLNCGDADGGGGGGGGAAVRSSNGASLGTSTLTSPSPARAATLLGLGRLKEALESGCGQL